jgi:predicted ABC-class ATPase
MRDRLTDLQADAPAETTVNDKSIKKSNKKDKQEEVTNNDMSVFFEELAGVKDQIQMIKGNVEEVYFAY